jgi:hypothetical protein
MKLNFAQVDRRIVVDAAAHADSKNQYLYPLYSEYTMPMYTSQIRQAPMASTEPPQGHIPLPRPGENQNLQMLPPGAMPIAPPPPMPMMGLPPPADQIPLPMPPPLNGWAGDLSVRSKLKSAAEEKEMYILSDFQLMLCWSQVRGFDLREKEWSKSPSTISCFCSSLTPRFEQPNLMSMVLKTSDGIASPSRALCSQMATKSSSSRL